MMHYPTSYNEPVYDMAARDAAFVKRYLIGLLILIGVAILIITLEKRYQSPITVEGSESVSSKLMEYMSSNQTVEMQGSSCVQKVIRPPKRFGKSNEYQVFFKNRCERMFNETIEVFVNETEGHCIHDSSNLSYGIIGGCRYTVISYPLSNTYVNIKTELLSEDIDKEYHGVVVYGEEKYFIDEHTIFVFKESDISERLSLPIRKLLSIDTDESPNADSNMTLSIVSLAIFGVGLFLLCCLFLTTSFRSPSQTKSK